MKNQRNTMYRIYDKLNDKYLSASKKNFWNRKKYAQDALKHVLKNRTIDDFEIHVFKIVQVDNMDINKFLKENPK